MTSEALTLQSSPIITFGYIMQVLFSLLIILGLLFLMGKYILPRLKVKPQGKLIKVLDRLHLAPQVSTYVIKVGQETWLIAVSNKNITKIDKINKESLPVDE